MRTRFFLLLGLVLLAGCDNGGSEQDLVLDGDYRITRLDFDSENTTFGVINVLPYLATSGTPPAPEISLDLFGRTRTYTFVYRLAPEAVRTSVQGRYEAFGTTALNVGFGTTGTSAARRILLPPSLRFAVADNGGTLTADLVHTVSFEDLATLDPVRYRGIGSGTLTGRLRVTAQRIR